MSTLNKDLQCKFRICLRDKAMITDSDEVYFIDCDLWCDELAWIHVADAYHDDNIYNISILKSNVAAIFERK